MACYSKREIVTDCMSMKGNRHRLSMMTAGVECSALERAVGRLLDVVQGAGPALGGHQATALQFALKRARLASESGRQGVGRA